jgi:ferredoxin
VGIPGTKALRTGIALPANVVIYILFTDHSYIVYIVETLFFTPVLNNMKIMDICVGCGQCVIFCPGHAISVCGQAMIGDTCTQCHLCIPYCPLNAIRRDDQ